MPADANKTLEEIYSDPFQFHGLINNHMVKMLSLTVDEMVAGALTRVMFSRERLERAKAALATVDVVGLQDHFSDCCEELHERFGFRMGAPVSVNRTETSPVASAFQERIAHDNALDVELYKFACELVEARRRERH